MGDKKRTFDIHVEERPDDPFDRLHLTLPLPRLLCLPEETRRHLRAARRERILAVRSLIDAAVERLEDTQERQGKTEHIKID